MRDDGGTDFPHSVLSSPRSRRSYYPQAYVVVGAVVGLALLLWAALLVALLYL